MPICYLGLGSNLCSPERQLRTAVKSLTVLSKSSILAMSDIYKSHPMGARAQPGYRNMVIALKTTSPPKRLLYQCQAMERKQSRVRKKHWGPRTLDVDILLYENRTIKTHNLTIPHPEMLNRDFVLTPLLEIAPNLKLPNGTPLHAYLEQCRSYVI